MKRMIAAAERMLWWPSSAQARAALVTAIPPIETRSKPFRPTPTLGEDESPTSMRKIATTVIKIFTKVICSPIEAAEVGMRGRNTGVE